MILVADVRIARYADVSCLENVDADIEAIFFEAAGPRVFESETARAAFRERWLLRYLETFPQEAFVAQTRSGRVVGYLVGCLEDPARQPMFADISYFAGFAHLTAKFPGHLHINLAADHRGAGIGSRLIEAFTVHAAEKAAPGIHAVTADGARNNAFYRRCGFERAGAMPWNGNPIAFFAKRLSPAQPVAPS